MILISDLWPAEGALAAERWEVEPIGRGWWQRWKEGGLCPLEPSALGLGLRKKRVSDGTETSVFDLAVALEALFAETR